MNGYFKKVLQRRRGLTGLETAIILIAFIIVAAAFAFAVLNMGFQTVQRSSEVMQSGLQEASSALELDGAVIAYADSGKTYMDYTVFYIKLSAGKQPVVLSTGSLSVAYTDPYIHVDNVYTSSDSYSRCTITEVLGDGDMVLEYGEKFKVVVNVTGIYQAEGEGTPDIGANEEFTVELKPAQGAILTVIRRLPPSLDTVMNLG
ncbi:MAG: hypothetical protein DRJ98_06990 [Thermoprotei archaeon]|nr:MAG: hypothetical protein DRJ98_06990 [Thermoprotei archaeon]RLF18167.1 MAG: hypothetical protein DRN06_02135 [Thermoprotei archaeon]